MSQEVKTQITTKILNSNLFQTFFYNSKLYKNNEAGFGKKVKTN